MKRLVAALAAVLAVLMASTPGTAAPVTVVPLLCRTTTNVITGAGAEEHRALEYDLFIPEHHAECSKHVNKIRFTETATETSAIIAMQNRTVHYLGLDIPLGPADLALMDTGRSPFSGGAGVFAVQLPMMVQGFVVATNVPDSCVQRPVKLTPLTLALIYSGVVTSWGDSRLTRDNDHLTGCNERISVAVRTDAAWSNSVVKDYMSKQDPAFAPLKQREALGIWPPTLMIGCRATSELTMAFCAANRGSIAFMNYPTARAQAGRLGFDFAKLQNASLQWTKPAGNPALATYPKNCSEAVPPLATDFADTSVAVATGSVLPPFDHDWSQVSMTYGRRGYALCAFRYVVALPSGFELFDNQTVRDHVTMMARPAVQAQLPLFGYAPIPNHLLDNVQFTAGRLSGPGGSDG